MIDLCFFFRVRDKTLSCEPMNTKRLYFLLCAKLNVQIAMLIELWFKNLHLAFMKRFNSPKVGDLIAAEVLPKFADEVVELHQGIVGGFGLFVTAGSHSFLFIKITS